MSETRRELEQIIARLKTMSHVQSGFKAGENGGMSTDDAKGGRRPTGGIDRKDDREPEWVLKSADHYQRRLASAHTEGILLVILADAKRTLKAWTHTPIPRGETPPYDHPQWKRWVAESERSNADIARIYNVSREYVRQVRVAYRDAA